jgi:hypothetical protein
MKLVELAMVQLVSIVEDERYFSILAFMKSKFHNSFNTHLPFVSMFAQWFYISHIFPYV